MSGKVVALKIFYTAVSGIISVVNSQGNEV